MKTFKKVLSSILIAALCVSSMPISAIAAPTTAIPEAADAAEVANTVDAAEAVNAATEMEPVNAPEGTEITETTEGSEAVESAETVDAAEIAEIAEEVEDTDTAEGEVPQFHISLPTNTLSKSPLFRAEKPVINAAVAELVQKGNIADVLTPGDDLLNTFSSLGLDFGVVKTYVADSIATERTGTVDMSMYPASQAAMDALMNYIKQERNWNDSITWSFSMSGGTVKSIAYTISDGYTVVMDELDGTDTPVTEVEVDSEIIDAMGSVSMEEVEQFTESIVVEPVNAGEAGIAAIADDDDAAAQAEGCAHTPANANAVRFLWDSMETYKDYDGDGIVNESDAAGDLIVRDKEDFILTFDGTNYAAAPATQTVYYVAGATYTCSKCKETVTGYYGYDSNLVYGYYSIMDAATAGASVLDGFIAQGFPVSYTANDSASIATGLQTVKDLLDQQYAQYGITAQGAMAGDIGFMHILVASNDDSAIAQVLNYLGGCEIVQPTAENYYDLYMAMYSTVFYVDYMVDGKSIKHEERNATEADLEKSYGAFSGYFKAKPEYFGFQADYWTSKETDATPIGAMKVMCQYDVDELVPTYYLNYMAEMLGQALMAYSSYAGYGEAIMTVRDEVIDLINGMGNASDVQKALAVHDYLANIANFDMNSIVQLKSNPNYQTSPLGMLPYACLLTGYTETDGALCLGYAAAYTYLMQWAVMGVDNYDEYNSMKNQRNAVGVDFIQVRYHSDVNESSVAGENSGFTEGSEDASAIFNETHYMNAVKIGNTWYNVDACYDDISPETMSQMRVETDGFISHAYFMLAASTMNEMFEGSYDYFDSLHDGYEYFKAEKQDVGTTKTNNGWGGGWGGGNWGTTTTVNARGESPMGYDLSGMTVATKADANGNYPISGTDADGWYVSGSDGYVYDGDGLVVYLYKEKDEGNNYNNDQYETAWFSRACSQVTWDDKYFYYVFDQDANLAERMEMADQMDDMGDDFDMDDMLDSQSENKVENADRLVRRARYSGRNNNLVTDIVNDDSSSSGMDYVSYKGNDEYTETLFHFGLASANPTDIDNAEEYAEENSGFTSGNNGSFESGTSDEDYDNWKNKNAFMKYVLDKDITYAENYPEVTHTIGMTDNKLYFNFANQIFAYNISSQNRSANNLTCATSSANITSTSSSGSTGGWGNWGNGNWGNWGSGGNNNNNTTTTAENSYKASTYYTVDAYQTNRAFKGMSFFTNKGSKAFTVTDHPIAAIAIYDKVTWQGPGSGVSFTPSVAVSIGTNYAQSYLKRLATDRNGNAVLDADGYVTYASPEVKLEPYQEEVPQGAYDPDYNNFGSDDEDEEKKNTEFMWCANVVDGFGTARLADMGTCKHENLDGVAWEYNSSQHWKLCPDCATQVEFADHSFDANGKCTVCQYQTHVHQLEKVDAVAPTCTEPGGSEYWKCTVEGCGCYFSDEECKNEIGEGGWVIAPTGHKAAEGAAWEADDTTHWHVCATCADPETAEKLDVAEHTFDDNATICNVCGYETHKHNVTATGAKAPTCTEAGNIAYWTCSECGRYFVDEACTTELTAEALVIVATGHINVTATAAQEATCETAGNSAYWACSDCSKYFSDAECTVEIEKDSWVLEALGHSEANLTLTPEVKATCTATGTKAYYSCSTCDKHFEDATGNVVIEADEFAAWVVIPMLEHKAAEDATWESDATHHWHICASCGVKLEEEHEMDESTNSCTICGYHGHKAEILVAAKSATCTEAGNSAYWTCFCDEVFFAEDGITVIEKDSWVINATGHSDESILKYDDNDHWYACATCEEPVSDKEGHKFDEATGTTCTVCDYATHDHVAQQVEEVAATCTDNGTKAHWTCTVCRSTFSDEKCENPITMEELKIPAIGHKVAEKLASDENGHWHVCVTCGESVSSVETHSFDELTGTSCTVCGYVTHEHVAQAVAAVAPTCTEPGGSEYWKCTVEGCGCYFSDEKCENPITMEELKIPATGHTVTGTPAKDAECRTEGNTAYWTCSACGLFFSDEDCTVKIAENSWVTPKLGHDFTYEKEEDKTYYTSKYDEKKPNGHYLHCTRCNSTDGASGIEPHVVTDCTQDSACIYCDYVMKASQTAHSFTAASNVVQTEATCESPAMHYKQCEYCTTTNSEGTKVGDPLGHELTYVLNSSKTKHIEMCTREGCDYTSKQIAHFSDKEATCTEDKVCVCGYVMKEKTGHHAELVEAKAPSCTEHGYNAYYYCADCNSRFADDTCSVPMTEDEWNAWQIQKVAHAFNETPSETVQTPASCTSSAIVFVKCDNCAEIDTEKTVAFGESLGGHNMGNWVITEETHSRECTREGCDFSESGVHQGEGSCTEAQICKDCEYEMAPALGHSFTIASDQQISEATCEVGAVYKAQCERCSVISDTETITGEPLSHTYNYTFNATVHTSYCVDCNKEFIVREAHSSSTEKATCGEAKVCDVCGYVMEAAKGHSGSNMETHAAVEATCTKAGNSAYYFCNECGKYFSDATGTVEIAEGSWIVPATGIHNYVKGVCSNCGAEDPDYDASEVEFDQTVKLEMGATHTITVSNLTTALTKSDIGNTDTTVVTVSVKSKSSGSSWGSNRRYTSTVTLTAVGGGTAYITVNGTVYKVDVCEHSYVNGVCSKCGDTVEFDETRTLEVGATDTITVNNLSTALTANDIDNTDDTVVGVSVSSTSSSGSSSGSWWGSSSRKYTSTVTLTALSEGTAYITVNGTVYEVIVTAVDNAEEDVDKAVDEAADETPEATPGETPDNTPVVTPDDSAADDNNSSDTGNDSNTGNNNNSNTGGNNNSNTGNNNNNNNSNSGWSWGSSSGSGWSFGGFGSSSGNSSWFSR